MVPQPQRVDAWHAAFARHCSPTENLSGHIGSWRAQGLQGHWQHEVVTLVAGSQAVVALEAESAFLPVMPAAPSVWP
jgi:hypothetical protein